MHHPCICNVILTIDDYFILLDNNDSRCYVEPIVDVYENGLPKLGLKIIRKLLNGYIHVFIRGEGRDNDEVTFHYLTDTNNARPIKSITIENNTYNAEKVRDAVRIILKLDKSTISKQCESDQLLLTSKA